MGRSRPDAVGKGTLLFLKASISILNSVGNFKNPHLLFEETHKRASLGLPGFCKLTYGIIRYKPRKWTLPENCEELALNIVYYWSTCTCRVCNFLGLLLK